MLFQFYLRFTYDAEISDKVIMQVSLSILFEIHKKIEQWRNEAIKTLSILFEIHGVQV